MASVRSALDHALIYAQWGWRVVPIKPGTKRPALDDWVKRATTDAGLISDWWQAHPDHGVGIVTGEQSGIWVLDVDPDHGGDDSLADLERIHGTLPNTIESITGGGGRHIIFRWPGWNPGTGAGKLGPGLDVRAEGGQIVAPPSVHPVSRQVYSWDLDVDPMQGCAPQDAPDWLLDLLKTEPRAEKPRSQYGTPVRDLDRPGDRFAAVTTWPQLLEADGATCIGTRLDVTGNNYELWCRPGKAPRDGASATLYYGGSDVLKVFTSNWPGLTAGETYTKFGYYTATHHGGDHHASASELGKKQSNDALRTWLENVARTPSPAVAQAATATSASVDEQFVQQVEQMVAGEDEHLRDMLVDWSTFWQMEHDDDDWFAEPVFARARGHAIYAPAKLGKSLLILDIMAAVATGREILGRANPHGPRHVLYIDYEMTLRDVHERLTDYGYDETCDLSYLHYASLPSLPPLDTFAGGAMVLRLARLVGAEFVVFDTISRAVEGEENSADTFRAFYRHTGMMLKAAEIGWARVAHAGKDAEKGMRGSSAANDDVDVVWRIEAAEGGLNLKRTHARMGWVDERLAIKRKTEPELKHVLGVKNWPAGVKECAEALDAQGIETDLGIHQSYAAVKAAGLKFSRRTVGYAQEYRRDRTEREYMRRIDSGDDEAGGE
jgi:hypothetical protein